MISAAGEPSRNPGAYPAPWMPMDDPRLPLDGSQVILFGNGRENRAYFKDGVWRDTYLSGGLDGAAVPILFTPRAWRPFEEGES